jgi:hypothetical protein
MLRLAALAAAIFLAAPVHAYTSPNRMTVTATGPATFSVRAAGGNYGANEFWCAAGWYAWRVLDASNNVRIYRLSQPPRRGGQPIVFSLDPTGKASRTGLAVVGYDDGSLSVATARAQCATTQMFLPKDW